MPAIFEHPCVVQPSDIDGLGHANNLAFLRWLQDAALAHSAAQGWPGARYRELGAGWVVRSHAIEYLRPAFVGEELVVVTWVADFRKATSLRRYRIERAAERTVLALAATDWAFVNYESGRPVRVPPEVLSAYELAPDSHVDAPSVRGVAGKGVAGRQLPPPG